MKIDHMVSVSNFIFLNNKFKRRFLKKFIGQNLLLIIELSERLQDNHEEMCKNFLSLLYTDKTEIFANYSRYFFEKLLCGEQLSSAELNFLFSEDMFCVAFLYGFLSMRSFPPEKTKLELIRLIQLLIVNMRPNIAQIRNPILIELKNGIKWSTKTIFQNSIENYKCDFKAAANNINSCNPFGNNYYAATTEFEIFLKKFTLNPQNYLTAKLKGFIYDIYYCHCSKVPFPDTIFINYLIQNPPEAYNRFSMV